MPPEQVQSDDSWRQQVMQRVANAAAMRGLAFQRLPAPPPSWVTPFAALSAVTPGVPTADLDVAWRRAASFWDPVLAEEKTGLRWQIERQAWGREQD